MTGARRSANDQGAVAPSSDPQQIEEWFPAGGAWPEPGRTALAVGHGRYRRLVASRPEGPRTAPYHAGEATKPQVLPPLPRGNGEVTADCQDHSGLAERLGTTRRGVGS